MAETIQVGDRVRLRKPHPCGADEWMVDRVDAEIGLRCAGCGRRVRLARGEFHRRLSLVLSRDEQHNQGDKAL